MNDREILDGMIKHKERSIAFFESIAKPERERQTAAALLKCLGIQFEPKEIESISGQFPDIRFRKSEFEIKEMQDSERKRHDELKADLASLKKATSLADPDLIERYSPLDLTVSGLAELIAPLLDELTAKYPIAQRSTTGLLVYCNLSSVSIEDSPARSIMKIEGGWQSVAVVGNGWAYVFHASALAPAFIRLHLGRLIHNDKGWS